MVARFGDGHRAALREQVANALVNKGFRLGALGRSEEEIAVYDEVVARFGDGGRAALREQVAKALVNKGSGSARSAAEEAIAVYDEVVARFGDGRRAAAARAGRQGARQQGRQLGRARPLARRRSPSMTRWSRGSATATEPRCASRSPRRSSTRAHAGALGRSAEEIAVYDDLVARFGDGDRAAAARAGRQGARQQGGQAWRARPQRGGEIAVYDDLLARFGDATEPPLREQVAKALVNKGIRLGQLQRRGEELAAYDDLIARFGDATEPGLREQVEEARRLRAGDEKVAAPQAAADG